MAVTDLSFFNPLNWFGGRFRQALRAAGGTGLYRSYFLGSNTPVLVDVNRLFDVYQECPTVNVVIDKKADMLSVGRLKVRNKKTGEDIENHWALEFMKNPNPLQSQREYIKEFSIYYDIYSNAFVYRNMMLSGKPAALWNLPPGNMKINPTGNWLDQTTLDGIIKNYELLNTSNGIQRTFNTSEVKYINTGVSKSVLVAESKLVALQLPVSNIIGAYKSRNLFLYKGPKIIVSQKSAADADARPMGEPERKRIEAQMNDVDYGIADGQSHSILSTSSLVVDKVSYPTKDLMLFEEIEADNADVCGAYGMNKYIFPWFKDSTYENQKQGEISTYQSTIAMAAESFCNFHDILLGLGENEELYMCFKHLSIMKEDELKEAQELKTKVESIAAMVVANIINPAQAQALIQAETDFVVDKNLESTNTTINRLREFSPLVATKLIDAITTNQILEILGLPGIGPEGDKPRNASANQNTNNQ